MTDVPARKVCMLGDFGVGKTSLVARFIHNTFSDKYLTTVGVKVDSKTVNLPKGRKVKLVLWDFAGKNGTSSLDRSYLLGAQGLILVVDGTSEETFRTALKIRSEVSALLNGIPAVLLLNKRDLVDNWELDSGALDDLRARVPVFETSAKTGDAVEQAFMSIALRLLP